MTYFLWLKGARKITQDNATDSAIGARVSAVAHMAASIEGRVHIYNIGNAAAPPAQFPVLFLIKVAMGVPGERGVYRRFGAVHAAHQAVKRSKKHRVLARDRRLDRLNTSGRQRANAGSEIAARPSTAAHRALARG